MNIIDEASKGFLDVDKILLFEVHMLARSFMNHNLFPISWVGSFSVKPPERLMKGKPEKKEKERTEKKRERAKRKQYDIFCCLDSSSNYFTCPP